MRACAITNVNPQGSFLSANYSIPQDPVVVVAGVVLLWLYLLATMKAPTI